MKDAAPQLLPLGPDGVLVRFSDRLSDAANRAALAFRGALVHDLPGGVTETATSLTSVLVRFRPDQVARTALEEVLRERLAGRDWSAAALPEGRKLWRIPAAFGGDEGPQLEEAAALAGVDPDRAVTEICAAPLRVLAIGFAPGQPYLGFLDDHWDIPRQTRVSPQVPQGAVVVAVRQVIPFANAAPTGWRQVGRTAFRCYFRDRDPAIALGPGDEVRFEPASASEVRQLLDKGDPMGGAACEALP